jgi:hypothetical protein
MRQPRHPAIPSAGSTMHSGKQSPFISALLADAADRASCPAGRDVGASLLGLYSAGGQVVGSGWPAASASCTTGRPGSIWIGLDGDDLVSGHMSW